MAQDTVPLLKKKPEKLKQNKDKNKNVLYARNIVREDLQKDFGFVNLAIKDSQPNLIIQSYIKVYKAN